MKKRLGQQPIAADVSLLRVLLGKCGLAQPGGWLPFSAYTLAIPCSAAGNPFAATVPRQLTIKTWHQRVNVQTTNNGSNYWSVQLAGWTSGVITTINTSTLTAGVSSVISDTAIDTLLSASETGLYIYVAKVGSPGNMFMANPAVFVT